MFGPLNIADQNNDSQAIGSWGCDIKHPRKILFCKKAGFE
jgi:hypothetical protein